MGESTARYRNPWHHRSFPQQGPSEYETDAKPTEYRGYLIYQRITGKCWDVVRNGECITQRAGMDGAKAFIDSTIPTNEGLRQCVFADLI